MANDRPEAAQAEDTQSRLEPVIVDLGKQKRKKVRRLRKGKGPLVDKVMEAHAEMRAQGLDTNGPILVVVKSKKSKRRRAGGPWLTGNRWW